MAPIPTIVTGAGSGIGRAAAVALAARGHPVLAVGRTLSKLEETRALAARAAPKGRVEIHAADLGTDATCGGAVRAAIDAFGFVEAAVLAAGIAPRIPLAQMTVARLEEVMRTNASSAAGITYALWGHFAGRACGALVHLSSLSSSDPFPQFHAYAASKAAMDSFCRSCHVEGEPLGIRSFCINPGCVETPLFRTLCTEEEWPRERTMSPEAVAAVILDCIEGRREADRGRCIELPTPG